MALPGGLGTLTEISLMWNLLLIGAIPPRPLMLVGPGWQSIIDAFLSGLGDYIPERERGWLSFAPDVEAAVQASSPCSCRQYKLIS